MPYSYLPLNRNHDYSTIAKIWKTFKFTTSVFFILCPLILIGKTVSNIFYMKLSIIDIKHLRFECNIISISNFISGYTAARSLGAIDINKEYHYIPPLSSFICVTSDIVTSIIIMLCMVGLLIAFIVKSVVEPKGSASNRNTCEPLPVVSCTLQYD